MTALSKLKSLLSLSTSSIIRNAVARRAMSDHRVFPLEASRWQWKKFKDLFHYYLFLGVIPLTAITCAVNIFIGPATLSEIPKDYTPQHWEYYRSPITRFIARYISANPQQEYEKYLAHILIEQEKIRLREIESQFKRKLKERNDYQAYYYRPVMSKYYRQSRESAEYIKSIQGD